MQRTRRTFLKQLAGTVLGTLASVYIPIKFKEELEFTGTCSTKQFADALDVEMRVFMDSYITGRNIA